MILKVAKNLDEYIRHIKEAKKENKIWFRGMSKATYSLEPSLFREKRIIGLKHSGKEINGRFYRKSEAIMKSDFAAIEKFIKHYKDFYPEKSQDYNLIDYLYIMQHYDIPTRLLDFSKKELIALYFSVSKDKNLGDNISDEESEFLREEGYSDKGSSVHCIDPIFTNINTYGQKKVLNIDDVNDIDTLYKLDLPVCVETNNLDLRIKAQEGVFMLYGINYKSYEMYDIFNKKTTKILIPNSCRKKIKQDLKNKYNISHTSVYPDMKGISLEIIDSIENKYRKDWKSVFK